MDLIPKPDQVVSAATNVASRMLYGGLADLRPMPRTLIDEGMLRQVHHYRPRASAREHGDPVLLVAPLAAPALCYDLRRGCSLVEHLVEQGRPTYLVEYGEVSFADRRLGIGHWVDEVVPRAIREASAHAGDRPVHVVGWSLGGVFALLTAADQPGLPLASLTVLGAPVDVSQVPPVAPFRPLLGPARDGGGLLGRAARLLGAVPIPPAGRALGLSGLQAMVTTPLAIAARIDDADFLAQVEAVDRFVDHMVAYPGRTFGQLYHRLLGGTRLATGVVARDDREIALADLRVPLLVVGGSGDGIAPVESVRPVVDLVTGARDARVEIVPGGHLGLLTGRAARTTTWPLLDEWFASHSSAQATRPTPAATRQQRRRTAVQRPAGEPAKTRAPAKKVATKKTPAKKATAKKAPVRKQPVKKTPAKKVAAKKTAVKKTADRREIGTNPTRRYGSASSRTLAARK